MRPHAILLPSSETVYVDLDEVAIIDLIYCREREVEFKLVLRSGTNLVLIQRLTDLNHQKTPTRLRNIEWLEERMREVHTRLVSAWAYGFEGGIGTPAEAG